MCCFFSSLLMLGPRVAVVIWWLVDPLRFSAAFNSFVWPVLGTIFLPWTTLTYLIIWSPYASLSSLKLVYLGLAVVADIFLFTGSSHARRNQVSRRYR